MKIVEPSSLKAAWELLEIFYADRQSHPWIPEQLVDWLADYDVLFSGQVPSVHLRLVEFQAELISIQAVENEPAYWQAISSKKCVQYAEKDEKVLVSDMGSSTGVYKLIRNERIFNYMLTESNKQKY